MKKIIFILLCFIGIKVVNAEGLVLKNLPYYIKLNDSNKIIRVKQIFENDTKDVLFNLDINKYEITSNMKKEDIKYFENLDEFNTIVYYGYNNSSKKYEDYFLTQILIWELISNLNFNIVDKNGNVLNLYDDSLEKIKNDINNHNKDSKFYNKTFKSLIGEKNKFMYESIILDAPVIDGLEIKTINNELSIIGVKEGNYTINLTKDFEQENHLYSDGKYIYYSSLKGPSDINKSFNLEIKDLKLNIKENIIGINNKYGDALLSSKYELYLNNELKNIIIDLEKNISVLPNNSYLLKDISNDIGINKINDIVFDCLNEDVYLTINKSVISKKIKLNIEDNNTYYIYLKSNNELYNVVNKDIKEIIMPYGLYYIVSEDKEYYKEIEVYNDYEENLNIEKEITVIEDLTNEIIKNDTIVDNPKTFDSIYLNIFNFLCCLVWMLIIKRKESNDN